MKRGDIVTVAINGDYGKPRPAVIIESDLLPGTDSVLVCFITTMQRDAPLHRLAIPANDRTGLRAPSQIMANKVMAVRRAQCGGPIGRAGESTMLALGRLLMFAIGIAD